MLLVDDFSNIGWVLFLKDKAGPTVTTAFRGFLASIKPVIEITGRMVVSAAYGRIMEWSSSMMTSRVCW